MATYYIACRGYSRGEGINLFFRNSDNYRLAHYTNLSFDEVFNLFKERFKQKYGLTEFSREAIDGTRLFSELGVHDLNLIKYDKIMKAKDELEKNFSKPVCIMVYNGDFVLEDGKEFEGHGIGFEEDGTDDKQIYVIPDTNLLISGGKKLLKALNEKDSSKFTQRDDIDLSTFCPKCSDDVYVNYFLNSNTEVVGTGIFISHEKCLEYCERTLKPDRLNTENLTFYMYTAGKDSDYYDKWYTSGYVTGFLSEDKKEVYVLPTGKAFDTISDWDDLCDKMRDWASSKTSSFLKINSSDITNFRNWCIDENEPELTQLVYNGEVLNGGVYPNVDAYRNHCSGEIS